MMIFELNLQDAGLTVNGHLFQDDSTSWRGNGTIVFEAGSHNVSAEWGSHKYVTSDDEHEIEDGASTDASQTTFPLTEILALKIVEVDGRAPEADQGFVVSFMHHPLPSLIRLAPNAGFAVEMRDWTDPPAGLRLFQTQHATPSLDESMRQLAAMKADARELHRSIQALQLAIAIQRYESSDDLHETLRQCPDVKCVVGSVYEKASDATTMLYMRLRHHRPDAPGGKGGLKGCWHKAWKEHVEKLRGFSRDWNAHHQTLRIPLDDWSVPADAPEDVDHGSAEPAANIPGPRRAHHLAHKILAALLIPAIAFAIVRRCCCCSCSRTSRAERRWLREARRNARSVRRAQRRQAFKAWFASLCPHRRFSSRPVDETGNEKSSMVAAQEIVLEEAMQAELRELRSAADFVSALANLEDGHGQHRQSPLTPPNTITTPPSSARPSTPRRSTSSSLPSYRSDGDLHLARGPPPPEYESDGDDGGAEMAGLLVADGFQYSRGLYTPGGSSPDTPDSSVVDTSPRSSVEGDAGAKE
ncbi:MAG: hypothetical protein M1832_001947 [Thelocarpon impressellum]|nr:MAG: hypothetical protein M1832_001947 [Thelocarpon impressellum]